MRNVFLSAMLLICAPVYADSATKDEAREFSSFLESYKAFAEKRAIQSKSHTARFGSNLVFRQECGNPYPDQGCDCPPGNRYIQCLSLAQAVIEPDPNDVGGRGYVAISADGLTLNNRGQWVPSATRGVYTTVIPQLGAKQAFDIPIPDQATIAAKCAGNSGPISLRVSYGAAMPMDIEFARRMKERSFSMGQKFEEQEFIFSRARLNGSRGKKSGVIGSVECRPLQQ